VVIPNIKGFHVYISSQCRGEHRLEYFFVVHAHRGNRCPGSLTWIDLTWIDLTVPLTVLFLNKMHAFNYYSRLSTKTIIEQPESVARDLLPDH
jgi:hypothetical protein